MRCFLPGTGSLAALALRGAEDEYQGDAEAILPPPVGSGWFKLYGPLSKGVWRTSSWCASGEPARLVEEYLVPLLRVWDLPDEIDFASLPSRLETKLQAASRVEEAGGLCARRLL